MRLSWDLIASTMAVVEHGSFSAAARALGVTQPTIRRHVEELEATLGLTLFTRSPTGLTPTDQARNLAPYGAEIAALVEAMVRSSTSDAHSASGTVRLTCSEVLAFEVAPALLEPLLHAHPKLEVELVASNRNQDLLHRDADIAVRMVRPTQTGLSAQRIGVVELGFYGSLRYLQRVGTPDDWDDLVTRCRLIGEDRETAILDALTSKGIPVMARNFAFRTDRDAVQLAAIRAGIGVGVCQVPIGDRDPRLQRVMPDIAAALDLWLVTHEDLRHQRRVRVVLDHLAVGLRRFTEGESMNLTG
jgi:DNA-binding transcriptional LysR family regulator